MRVLHLIPTLGGGGAERQIAYLAQGLQARGCDVHVAIDSGGPNLERLAGTGATVHWIRTAGNYDPMLLLRLARLMRSLRPDIVQTWLTRMDVAGGAAALITGSRWIVSERAAADHYPRDTRHRLRRAVGRFADAIVANSNDGLGFWTSSRAAKFVVPNALDFDAIAAAPATEDLGAAKMILFAGRLTDQKNVLNLVDALAVAMKDRDAVALLCGTGELEGAIRARIGQRGLADRVRMLGYVDSLWALMKRADVLVAPSWFEGHPNVVLEGAACGCPLVISDIVAHREVFDERSAELVPPSDVSAIAAAISRVLDDPEAARARARLARDVVSRLSISATADAYLRIYERLIAPPQSDAPVHRH
jgi:glycosyltransferase involved in cell wall biosynthesis